MLLVKMEDCSSFPSMCLEDPFQLIVGYGDGLCGRKKKKKESVDVAECRLDSPCNSPEVIMSGSVEDGRRMCPKLLHSDSFTDEYDSGDHGSTFDGVDMEGFCEIDATVTAGEDIMLSSSAKESTVVMKKLAPKHELSNLTMEDAHGMSRNVSSAGNGSGLQSQFENDVDLLLNNSLWRNKEVVIPAPGHDLLPDLSGLAVSGYLLSDIPSHPDLSCEASESVDSLLSYCGDNDECLNSSSAVPHIEHNKEDLTSSIKCDENICPQDEREAVYSDFDALCTNTLLDGTQSNLNVCPRTSSCRCRGDDSLCYRSEVSSTEEDDVCIEYIMSHQPSKARRAKGRSAHLVRRGPGRPRKLHNTEFIRRGPGRPRKKSVSDAVVWYQTRRKRTVSFSNGCRSRNRQKSQSDDKDEQNFVRRTHVPDNAEDKIVKPKRSHVGETEAQSSCSTQTSPSLQSVETGTAS